MWCDIQYLSLDFHWTLMLIQYIYTIAAADSVIPLDTEKIFENVLTLNFFFSDLNK